MKHLFTIFLLAIAINTQAQVDFNQVSASFQNLHYSASQWADFNNDGNLDFLIFGEDENGTYHTVLYLNNGDETFTEVTTTGLPDLAIGAIDTADFNGDGLVDVIMEGADASSTGQTDIWLNNGDSTFTAMNLSIPQAYMGDIAACDYDNDGDVDFAMSGYIDQDPYYITKIFSNNGDNTFTELSLSIPGVMYGVLKWADYDNDGFIDLLVTGFADDFYTQIWHNDDQTTFSEQNFGFEQLWLNDAEFGDLDGDGDLDLFLTGVGGNGSNRHTILYENTGNDFIVKDSSFVGVSHSSVELADFDNDGDLDIFYSGLYGDGMGTGEYMAKVMFNDGQANFSDSLSADLPGFYWGECTAANINDNTTYLLLTGYTYKNDQDETHTLLYKAVAQTPTSIQVASENNSNINVYPNPAMNFVNIRSNSAITNVKIYSATGELVFTHDFNSNSVTFGIQNLPQGVYKIITQNGKESTSSTFIKK